MRSIFGFFVWLALYCGVGYGVYVFWYAPSISSTPANETPEVVWSIRAIPAEPQDHILYRQLRGEVAYGETFVLSFRMGGCLAEVSTGLAEGAAVSKGDVLARLDVDAADLELQRARQAKVLVTAMLNEGVTELEVSRARQDRAQREVDVSERQLLRSRDLFDNRLVSRSALDRLEQDHLAIQSRAEAAAEDVMMATSRLETLRAERFQVDIAIREAQVVLDNMTLRAPQDGIVTQDNLTGTTCVAAYAPLLEISEPTNKVVEVALSHLVISDLTQNEPLVGRPVQFFPPYANCTGRVGRLENRDTQVNGATLRIDLDPDCAPQLKENELIPLRITSRHLPDTIRLPAEVEWDTGQIFVVDNNRLQSRTVSIAARDESWLYIKDGIAAGDLVLSSRPEFAIDGQRVQVISN